VFAFEIVSLLPKEGVYCPPQKLASLGGNPKSPRGGGVEGLGPYRGERMETAWGEVCNAYTSVVGNS